MKSKGRCCNRIETQIGNAISADKLLLVKCYGNCKDVLADVGKGK
jgi:hypothetical protein